MKNKQTTWELIKNLVNKKDLIFRSDLIQLSIETTSLIDTLENYRSMLGKAGYITKANGSGVYYKLRDIPDSLTITDLRLIIEYPERISYYNDKGLSKWVPIIGIFTKEADKMLGMIPEEKLTYILYQAICYISLMIFILLSFYYVA